MKFEKKRQTNSGKQTPKAPEVVMATGKNDRILRSYVLRKCKSKFRTLCTGRGKSGNVLILQPILNCGSSFGRTLLRGTFGNGGT